MHRATDELASAFAEVTSAPPDRGELLLIVTRPAEGERETHDEARLDIAVGLVGDTWDQRGSRRTDDGSPHPDMQLNVMNARVAALLAVDPDRRALAGDQLYLDLDLSEANLPPGTRVRLGEAVIEFTDQPHTGCAKFAERFGRGALRWVNSPEGRANRLRGACAKVVEPGTIRVGDRATKVPNSDT